MTRFLIVAALLFILGCSKPEDNIILDTQPQQADGGFVIDTIADKPEPAAPVPEAALKPMRLEVVSGPKHIVTIHTTVPCDPCVKLHKKWGDGNERIHIIWDPTPVKTAPDSYPAIRWNDSKGVERYPSRNGFYFVPDTLGELLEIIERNTPPAAKVAGWGHITLHGRQHVVAALEKFRGIFGEEAPTTIAWKRNGSQTLPLLSKQKITLLQLLGTDGRLVVSSPKSKIWLKDGELSYRHLHGSRWKLGASTEIDLADDGTPTVASSSPQKVGEVATILTLIGAFRSVWSILHPSADLIIGGDVSAAFTLQGNMLAVDFQDMPAVRVTILFSIFPRVKRVELTPDKLRFLTTSPWPFKEFSVSIVD